MSDSSTSFHDKPATAAHASASASAAGPTSPGATISFRKGLPHSQELAYASRQLTAIEVNGTYYSTFKPATFAKWRDETPDGFVFSLKATRFATNRKLLATAGDSIERFVDSGIGELGDKLGPIVWQFMPTKQFDAGGLRGLPRAAAQAGGRPRAAPCAGCAAREFRCARLPARSRAATAAPPCTPTRDKFPGDRRRPRRPGLHPADAQRSRLRNRLPARACSTTGRKARAPGSRAQRSREVFVFFINGAKERAPAAAVTLIQRLS